MKASAARANDCTMARAWTIDQQPALVGAVGDQAGPRAEQEHRERTGRRSSRPTAKPLWVSLSTSSVWATSVSQLPTWEMSCPPKKRRKLRTRNERNVLVRSAPHVAFGLRRNALHG